MTSVPPTTRPGHPPARAAWLLHVVWLLALAACVSPHPAPRRPNVVVFLVDDLGWQDSSQPFAAQRTPQNDTFRTPNVERLCAGGARFTDAYAHTVCSPSRVSLLTGMAPSRHGVTHWTLHRDRPTDPERDGLLRPEWNVNGLSPDPATPRAAHVPAERTLPGRLRAAGYRTIHVGKAHLGARTTPGADPRALGFDVNVAGHAAGAPSSHLAAKGFLRADGDEVWQVPGLERWHGQDLFLTDVLTTEAIAAADAAVDAREPFFLYLSHYAVHTPLDADERFVAAHRARGMPEPEARYAALVEGMDHSLGRVLDWLDRRDLADDTIVLFVSDNGGLSANSRGGSPHMHNLPLRSGKGSAYEGGTRVPLAVRWPRRVAPGTGCSLPVQIDDLLPTICDLVDVDSDCADGRSFAPALRGEAMAARPLFFHHPHYWGSQGPGIEPHSSVRDGNHKLIWFYRDARCELYDLARDVGETDDLSEREPALASRLRVLLRLHLTSTGARLPRLADGSPAPLP